MSTLDKLIMKPRFIIYTVAAFFFSVIIWSYFAHLKQVVITEGKLKPRTDVQEIQSLEGGIIRDIYVKPGDRIEQGQPLLRLDDIAFKAALNEQLQQMDGLRGDIARYQAELEAARALSEEKSPYSVKIQDFYPEGLSIEARNSARAAYRASIESLELEINTINKRVEQAAKDVAEEKNHLVGLRDNLRIAREELKLNEPAYKKGAISGIEMLKLRRAVNEAKAELDATRFDIDRKIKQQQEAKLELSGVIAKFRTEIQDKLNGKSTDLAQLNANNTAIQDKVQRTTVSSPVAGIVKSVFTSTTGGVIQPGETMIEIVPFDKEILVEVKVNPADIGFLKLGLPALVKLSAYDFVTYGGIEGKLSHISADTITDEEGNAYYIGHVSLSGVVTDSGYVTEIKPGMQASVDLITGEKTIMEYWLKPILRAKATAMREI